MDIKENISLAKHTTFKIGGPAKYFCITRNKEDLVKAVKKAKELNLPFFILGGGSNVLASDKGYNGLIIKIENCKLRIENCNLYTEAGVKLEEIVKLSDKKSLTGMEWAAGIPGTVGGAVYGNAQAFDVKMSDIVKSVEVLDTKNLKIKNLLKKQCLFSAKKSIFKKNKNLIILSATLKLKKGDKKEIQKAIKEHLNYRKKNHPLRFSSAGSVFVNKTGGPPSAYLIEKCGLKGTKVGGAEVSKKHAGFIINTGKAKAKDVLKLIKIIKQKVKNKLGIKLEEEVQIIKY
ncbi:UDP-N-acetylmuramate dehydrogenase [Patescibacteria group bacterium]|nr:UDP-N-acetylmuramate dehydrogenase [Patescibacteria group bacterium]